ncbi:MAG TPA: hypothetical protein PK772_06335 [Chitinophagaceae bacterium]|nr:hypothetical protein [Chitinophagaceae bacterium]
MPKKSHKGAMEKGPKAFDCTIIYIQMALQTKLLSLTIKYTIYTYGNQDTTNP